MSQPIRAEQIMPGYFRLSRPVDTTGIEPEIIAVVSHPDPDVAKDRAETLALRVNVHDALVAALVRLVNQAEMTTDFTGAVDGTLHSAIRQARAALAPVLSALKPAGAQA